MTPTPRIATSSPRWTVNNRTFEVALALLAHPVSLAALGILLLNDHLLRRLWPSWWTGKLGDIAWLIFAPLALAALMAWLLLPLREPRRQQWTFWLSIAGTGLTFLILKTVPGILVVTMRSLSIFLHAPLALVQDPTDLLALPALAVPYLIWRTSPHLRLTPARGWIVLPLAAMLTLANSGIPDYGIQCLSAQAGQLRASSNYGSFSSSDGGLSWTQTDSQPEARCSGGPSSLETNDWVSAAGVRPGEMYRFRPSGIIQISGDDGQTWKDAYTIPLTPEAQRYYFFKSRYGYTTYYPGPLDALADPTSGNMLFAMSQQGILVHTAGGEWTWRPAGEYQPLKQFPTTDSFVLLLGGMLILAGAAVVLVYSTLALHWTRNPLRITLLGLGWLSWLGVDILFPPAQAWGYGEAVSAMGMGVVVIWTLALAIEQTVRLARRAPRRILGLFGIALLAGLLYFLPYLLWLYSTLPGLIWATGFGLLLVVCVLVAAFVARRRELSSYTSPNKENPGSHA